MFNDDQQNSVAELHDNMRLAREQLVSKVFNSKLAALRAQNPFLQIVSVPDKTCYVNFKTNVPIDVFLPSGTKMIMVRKANQNNVVYASFAGTASLPPAGGTTGAVEYDSNTFSVNDNIFMYVEEIQTVSILSTTDGQLSIMCWSQL